MHFIPDVIAQHPLFGTLNLAFLLWMLIDAYRRHAEYFWYFIILFVPFFGPLIYFFVVLLPDLRLVRNLNVGSLFQRRVSLDELAYRAEQTPTLTNHFNLAQRLIELHRPSDALPHLQAALKTEPEHASCLFALARCRADLGEHREATVLLEKLLARDPRWSNYSAWRLLIDVRTRANDERGALAACRELARLSPSLENQCLLAEHLTGLGQTAEARAVLERSLRDHDFTPAAIRRRNWKWAKQARRLLSGLPQG